MAVHNREWLTRITKEQPTKKRVTTTQQRGCGGEEGPPESPNQSSMFAHATAPPGHKDVPTAHHNNNMNEALKSCPPCSLRQATNTFNRPPKTARIVAGFAFLRSPVPPLSVSYTAEYQAPAPSQCEGGGGGGGGMRHSHAQECQPPAENAHNVRHVNTSHVDTARHRLPHRTPTYGHNNITASGSTKCSPHRQFVTMFQPSTPVP